MFLLLKEESPPTAYVLCLPNYKYFVKYVFIFCVGMMGRLRYHTTPHQSLRNEMLWYDAA